MHDGFSYNLNRTQILRELELNTTNIQQEILKNIIYFYLLKEIILLQFSQVH